MEILGKWKHYCRDELLSFENDSTFESSDVFMMDFLLIGDYKIEKNKLSLVYIKDNPFGKRKLITKEYEFIIKDKKLMLTHNEITDEYSKFI